MATPSHHTHSDRRTADNAEDKSVRNGAPIQQGIHHTHGVAGDNPEQQSVAPADKVRDPACEGVSRRPRKNGSLLSWRTRSNNSSEPRAYALALVNLHNICYANAVLHMLHQARSP